MIKLKLQAWTENNGILGELHNGFRISKRLDENLFVLTQCTEKSREERQPLHGAFLDITGTYNSVDCYILWDILEGEGLGNDCIQLLRELYLEKKYVRIPRTVGIDLSEGLYSVCFD